jgi:uncharacterized protein YdgA (DUF945 family)
MKLFTKLSTILTVAFATTFANAQTTDVTTSELVKAQPIIAAELINTVELNLVQSMEQLKVTFANETINNQKLFISQAKTKRNSKGYVTKVTLAAE